MESKKYVPRKNFPDAQKLSGEQCSRAPYVFLSLIKVSVSSIKEAVGVGCDMLVVSDPEPFPSPNKVEGEANITFRRLGSLLLVYFLGSPFCLASPRTQFSLGPVSKFPTPLSCESAPALPKTKQPSGTPTPWGFTGTMWASWSKGYMVTCSSPSVQVTLILSSLSSSSLYSPSPLGVHAASEGLTDCDPRVCVPLCRGSCVLTSTAGGFPFLLAVSVGVFGVLCVMPLPHHLVREPHPDGYGRHSHLLCQFRQLLCAKVPPCLR